MNYIEALRNTDRDPIGTPESIYPAKPCVTDLVQITLILGQEAWELS